MHDVKRFGKNLLVISIVVMILGSGSIAQEYYSSMEDHALIVDALAADRPNPSFIDSAISSLEEGGYKVDLLTGENVTVDTLKSIDAGYDVVVFRVHSEAFKNQVFLFTAEPYSDYKHLQEQMMFEVTGASPGWSGDPVFAVGLNFMERHWRGKFNGSLILMMGCRGFYNGSDIEGQKGLGASYLTTKWFIQQGASGYVGWDGLVDLEHTDKAISLLLRYMFTEGRGLDDVVNAVMREIGPDAHGSKLRYVIPH